MSRETETRGEAAVWPQTQRVEGCSCEPGDAQDCRPLPEPEEARKDSTQSRGRSVALLTPCFQTSSLRNRARKYLYCFQPPSLWHFVMAALGH